MSSEDETKRQLERLEAHRLTLHHYLLQRAKLGAAYVPPGVAHGIAEARREIQQIRNRLLAQGHIAASHPDDEDEQPLKSTVPSSFSVTNSQQAPDDAQPDNDGHARAVGGTSILQAASEEPATVDGGGSEPPMPQQPSDQSQSDQQASNQPPDPPTGSSNSTSPYPNPFFVSVRIGETKANKNDVYVVIARRSGIPATSNETVPEPFEFRLPFELDILPDDVSSLSEWRSVVFGKLIKDGHLLPNDTSKAMMGKFGSMLFEAIFPREAQKGAIYRLYESLANQADDAEEPVRLNLMIDSSLEKIPWELLWCPKRNDFFSTDSKRTLIRLMPLATDSSARQYSQVSRHSLNIVTTSAFQQREDGECLWRRFDRDDVTIECIDRIDQPIRLIQRLVAPEPIHILHLLVGSELLSHLAEFVQSGSSVSQITAQSLIIRLLNLIRDRTQRILSIITG